MLGLILIYFIGKSYYDLAQRFHKKKWLYVVLSLFVFYGAQFIFGIGLGVVSIYTGAFDVEQMDEFVIDIVGLSAGILLVWIAYKFLKYQFTKSNQDFNEILDVELV